MNRVILIKYGELTTKKGNRNFFINTLYNNIKDKLKNYNVKISKDRSRIRTNKKTNRSHFWNSYVSYCLYC